VAYKNSPLLETSSSGDVQQMASAFGWCHFVVIKKTPELYASGVFF